MSFNWMQNKTMTTQAAIKKAKDETLKRRQFLKLLVVEHKVHGSEDGSVADNGSLDDYPKNDVTPTVQKPMTIVQVEKIGNSHEKSNKALNFQNPAEDSIVIEDDDEDVEMIEPLPNIRFQKQDAQCAQKTASFHYGMAIAKDVFELNDDLKIDAKIEIMQIIGKYQKRQLRGTDWDSSVN